MGKAGWLNRNLLLGGLVAVLLLMPPAMARGAAQPDVIKQTPGMRISDLAGRPDSTRIQLSNGKMVRLGELRRFDAAAKGIRAAMGSRLPLPSTLKVKPVESSNTVKLRSNRDLTAMLKRPDTDTMRLPSGRVVTAGQLKFLQPQLEKKLGRPLGSVSQTQPPSGPAVKVGKNITRGEWDALMRKPDNTILETANGKRTTVGALKQAIAAEKGSGRRMPTNSRERRNNR